MTKDAVPTYFGHRERLRQRYKSGEGKDMADYELLELLLTVLIPRKDVKPIAKDLIAKFGDFNKVVSAPLNELVEVKGIKENTALMIKFIKTCTLRASWQDLHSSDAPIIANFDALIDYCRASMADLPIEEFHLIYLNAKVQVIGEETLQRGTIDKVAVHPREVIKAAMANNARGIILVHNHPSGDINPSVADKEITKQIIDAAKTVDLYVFDHIVVSKSDVYSFRAHGLLEFYLPPKNAKEAQERMMNL